MKKYSFLAMIPIVLYFFPFRGIVTPDDTDFYPPTSVPDRIILNLTAQPATSMAVSWRTSLSVSSALVELAVADASPTFMDTVRSFEGTTESFLTDRNGANFHSVVMDSLQPQTQYAYRVGNGTYWSEWAHFSTASQESGPVSFLYFGDAQNELKSLWSRAIRGAYQKMPKADFLLHAGDLVNRANSDHEWGEWFYAGGWIYSMTPSVATPGNHEYYRINEDEHYLSRHWRPTFTQPENGPEHLEETVFFIDYQDVRIISLNSVAMMISARDSSAQVKWLDEILSNNEKKWTIVTMHYPVYSTKYGRDNAEIRNALQPLLEKHRVDLVLQGHDHAYGRGTNLPIGKKKHSLKGPIYVVSVSGPKMYDLGLESWVQRAASNTQLYQLIHIDNDLLRFEAFTVTGELYDAFELEKSNNNTNLFTDLAPPEMEERLEMPKTYQMRYTKEEWEKYRERFKAYKERQKKSDE